MSKRKKTTNPNIRKPYYELSDGMVGIKEALRDSKDQDVKRRVEELEQAIADLKGQLDKNYNWD